MLAILVRPETHSSCLPWVRSPRSQWGFFSFRCGRGAELPGSLRLGAKDGRMGCDAQLHLPFLCSDPDSEARPRRKSCKNRPGHFPLTPVVAFGVSEPQNKRAYRRCVPGSDGQSEGKNKAAPAVAVVPELLRVLQGRIRIRRPRVTTDSSTVEPLGSSPGGFFVPERTMLIGAGAPQFNEQDRSGCVFEHA
jgi:hypothetical protein